LSLCISMRKKPASPQSVRDNDARELVSSQAVLF
jgi:hypothetical protein